eukprot:jgi/Psemu1/16235/gm1.16235_g
MLPALGSARLGSARLTCRSEIAAGLKIGTQIWAGDPIDGFGFGFGSVRSRTHCNYQSMRMTLLACRLLQPHSGDKADPVRSKPNHTCMPPLLVAPTLLGMPCHVISCHVMSPPPRDDQGLDANDRMADSGVQVQ